MRDGVQKTNENEVITMSFHQLLESQRFQIGSTKKGKLKANLIFLSLFTSKHTTRVYNEQKRNRARVERLSEM